MTQDGISKKAPDYGRLDVCIGHVVTNAKGTYDSFKEYLRVATEEEGLTPQAAWQYVASKASDSLIPHSTLYRWADKALPEGTKKIRRPKGQNQEDKGKSLYQDEAGEIPTWEFPDHEPEPDPAAEPATEREAISSNSTKVTTTAAHESDQEEEEPQEKQYQRSTYKRKPKIHDDTDLTNCMIEMVGYLSGRSYGKTLGTEDPPYDGKRMPIGHLISESINHRRIMLLGLSDDHLEITAEVLAYLNPLQRALQEMIEDERKARRAKAKLLSR